MSASVENFAKAIEIVDEKIRAGQLPEKDRLLFIDKFNELFSASTAKKGPAIGTAQKCLLCGVAKKGHQCPKRKISEVSNIEDHVSQKKQKISTTEIITQAMQNLSNAPQTIANALPKNNNVIGQLNDYFSKETKGESQVARMQASYERLKAKPPSEPVVDTPQMPLQTSISSVPPGNYYGSAHPNFAPPYPSYPYWAPPTPMNPYWYQYGQVPMPMQMPWGTWPPYPSCQPPMPKCTPAPQEHHQQAPNQPTSYSQHLSASLHQVPGATQQQTDDIIQHYTSVADKNQKAARPPVKPRTLRDIVIKPNTINLPNTERLIQNDQDLLTRSKLTAPTLLDPSSPETGNNDEPSRVLELRYESGQVTSVIVGEEDDATLVAEWMRDPEYDYDYLFALPNEQTPVRQLNKIPLIIDDSDDTAVTIDCSICQETVFSSRVLLRELPCGHLFCADCIDSWFTTNHKCPNCRSTVE